MPRTAKLANYFNSNQLYQKYRQSTNSVESKRWHLLGKISLGWNIKQSAMMVGIHYQYALIIVKKYNQVGSQTVLKKRVKAQPKEHKGGKNLYSIQCKWKS